MGQIETLQSHKQHCVNKVLNINAQAQMFLMSPLGAAVQ